VRHARNARGGQARRCLHDLALIDGKGHGMAEQADIVALLREIRDLKQASLQLQQDSMRLQQKSMAMQEAAQVAVRTSMTMQRTAARIQKWAVAVLAVCVPLIYWLLR
jgi:hypothetical protein